MSGPGEALPPAMDGPPAGGRSRQPWLHHLETAVHGHVTSLSHATGDIDVDGIDGAATGLYVDDRRILSRLVLEVDGVRPVGVVAASEGSTTECLLVARNVGDPGPDPTVEVRRHRLLTDVGLEERISITSRAGSTVRCTVTMTAQGDGAELHEVKVGTADRRALPVRVDDHHCGWADDRHLTELDAPHAVITVDGTSLVAAWEVSLPHGATTTLRLDVRATRIADTPFNPTPGAGRVGWSRVRLTSRDARLGTTVRHSLTDLEHLLLADPEDPRDVFAAAGSPWYLTLFGRDSIWAARMTLPFGTDLARGTLRALARRQGQRDDPDAAEQPGKILHELRRTTFVDPGVFELPPTYYGTVDATPLWVCLLHDAWRWGLPPSDVLALRPALEGAMGWLRRSAAEGGGLVRYHDPSGNGLSNQGWKDSGDAMRTAQGTIAAGPIALVETQAYAVEAALGAADLFEGVLDEDGTPWRDWAFELVQRVRQQFWVTGEDGGRYLAMAVDGTGGLVDGIGSNMGHVIGSGLLDPSETAEVVAALGAPEMLSPLGLRTLSSSNPAYNPLGYHTGSIWTHDTAICAFALARTGHTAEASQLAAALVDVAAASGYRWPELYAGEPVHGNPAPYPASCRPQAWAAASAGLLVSTVLGLRADAPRGVVEVAPLPEGPFGAVHVEGIRVGGRSLALTVDGAGRVVDVDAEPGLEVRVRTGSPS